MIRARLEDGWIRVTYDGAELARVEIGVGESEPMAWLPAYLNTVGTERVAQVRPGMFGRTAKMKVWMRIDGVPMLVGRLGDDALQRDRRRR